MASVRYAMMKYIKVDLRSITRADVSAVASFPNGHRHRALVRPRAAVMIYLDGRRARVGGRTLRGCDLGARCVVDVCRSRIAPLVRPVVAQPAGFYTDLSPGKRPRGQWLAQVPGPAVGDHRTPKASWRSGPGS